MAEPNFGDNRAREIARTRGVTIVKTAVLKATLPQVFDTDIPDHISYLGTPVYDSVLFGNNRNEVNTYIDLLGNDVNYASIGFDEVLIDVSRQKNIVRTPIQGATSEVIQYVSNNNYAITITGQISARYSQGKWRQRSSYYPKDELSALHKICEAGYAIPVVSKFLNELFNIDNVVIENYRFPQQEGKRYAPVFEINCISYNDVVLEFTEEEVNDSDTLANILNR